MNTSNICVLVNTARCSGRGILQGILRFSASRYNWKVHVCNVVDHGYEQAVQLIASGNIKGVIASDIENDQLIKALEHVDVPLAIIGTRNKGFLHRHSKITCITSDERRIGRTAAQHFRFIGKFNSYGYVPPIEPLYQYLSSLRENGFTQELSRYQLPTEVYKLTSLNQAEDTERLALWLKSLPKPAAILCCRDQRAANVISICNAVGIAIPGEIRILGVDNDEFVCLPCRPTLSSISRDTEMEGFDAALHLDRILKRPLAHKDLHTHFVKTGYQVISRSSTSTLAPGLDLVRRAREFITLNATHNITVKDILAHLHVSKRLLYLRFSEFSNISLGQTINSARIAHVKKLLLSSRNTLQEIAIQSGFRSTIHLRRTFQGNCGSSPSEWRKNHTFKPSGSKKCTARKFKGSHSKMTQ